MEALGAANRFPHLRVLSIRNNLIGDAGAIALAKAPQMETLEELNLRSNKIGDAGAKALLDSPHFEKLKSLDLTHNKMSRSMKTLPSIFSFPESKAWLRCRPEAM